MNYDNDNDERKLNNKSSRSKLDRKPLGFKNPVGNDSRLEEPKKVKSYLHNINDTDDGKKGGVPLYYDEKDIFVDSEDSHTLIIGSTGSKKTRLVVLPTVLLLGKAEESMIICDPKAEVYKRTAAQLNKDGYKVLVLNFRNPSVGESWNPLDIPYKLYKRGEIDRACEFVNDIATNLMLADMSSKDPYWDYSAADLFFGLTFLTFKLLKDEETVSIGNVLELRRRMFIEENHINTWYEKIAKEDDLIYHSILGTIHNATSTRACILSTFDQKMRCFMYQKNLLDMMSDNSISLDGIGNEKTIIYLIMPDEKATYHKLITLFVKQSYEYLIYKSQEETHEEGFRIRINYLLDEFSTLPTIKDFPNMITAARSRNIRFNLVIQSFHQLKARYHDEAETIKANCNNWIYLTSRELELLREISELCGRDKAGQHIFSISSLQHFDKSLGQALILCGRLFPYVAELKDISEYDNEEFEILEFKKQSRRKYTASIPSGEPTKISSLDELFV